MMEKNDEVMSWRIRSTSRSSSAEWKPGTGWRSHHRSERPDLSHADLQGANLRYANLNAANLSHARLEGANLGRAYLEAAELEGAGQRGAHFFNADLGRADLRNADLREAQLWHARLERADLQGADLTAADLRYSDLTAANASGARLESANLSSAFLLRADLRGARLTGARIVGAQFWATRLEGADLSGATMAWVALNNVDLSRIDGLAAVHHDEPSSVGIDTLERTAAGLARDSSRQAEVETFLRHAGVFERYLELFKERVRHPAELAPTYIRYSQADRAFAERLHDALQDWGVRCWLHEHPMLPGGDAHEALDIGRGEKLLLCASEAALGSWWIGTELAHVEETEARLGEKVLLAAGVDGALAADESEKIVSLRQVADFAGWEDDPSKLEREAERIVAALGRRG